MANFNINKVILGGRLCADPELKTTASGAAVTSFSLAVNRRFTGEGKEQQADFISVVAWRQTAEFITRYFRKGSSICIVGSIRTRSWTDQNGNKRYATDIVADEAMFVDGKNDGATAQGAAPSAPGTAPQSYMPDAYSAAQVAPQFDPIRDDEDLPF